ncbi:MAG: right-handed parallel beta-helix repeat-containing protein [Flavobacteriales bacterium]|nr:right-handed parallel beta-helix repeat-containing protein [Flavobacteriales bacterium]
MSKSGTSAQPLVFGAYGTGTTPVISGSIAVGNWSPYQGSIWVASVPQPVAHVYVAGERMTLARYPNSGWLNMASGSTGSINDPGLGQPAGYWNGARVVIRSSGWCFETPTVTAHTAGMLNHSGITHNPGPHAWSYYLCNKLSELDSPGEWYHDVVAGQLYLWTPDGSDPNTLLVEAATAQHGAVIAWSQQHVRVQDLAFRHQTYAGIKIDGASNCRIQSCDMRQTLYGIRSFGTSNSYVSNVFNEIYGQGAMLIDNSSVFESNTLTDVGLVPGSGDGNWSHFGIRATGTGNVIRQNRLLRIGYSGIEVNNDALVERNVIDQAVLLLNDGGGIAFDNANGLIIRDNVIRSSYGNINGTAPTAPGHYPIAHGIYFGNTQVTNTLVQYNTVTACRGSGIHVDHTMVSSGIQVKHNVLYNNAVQLSLSDLSNYNGPGAVPPYYVPNYNDVYEGNTLYSLSAGQACMLQYNVHSASLVDFGTYTANKYHNPYEPLLIRIHNTNTGEVRKFTLARWQAERGEDLSSTTGDLSLQEMQVTEVLSGELVANGTFNSNVNDWGAWPTNGQVTHSLTYLDNGALRSHLPNASQYPEMFLRNNTPAPIVSGNWYRMRFSTQANVHGELRAGTKGMTQMTGNAVIHERSFPFGPSRRDQEHIFQSGLSDQAILQFVHHHSEPTYWLDNVSLQRVAVAPADPEDHQLILINDTDLPMDFNLTGCWSDLNQVLHSNTIQVPAFRSVVLLKVDDVLCGLSTGSMEWQATSLQELLVHPNPAPAGSMVKVDLQQVDDPRHMDLIDPNGRLIAERMPISNEGHFRLPDGLPAGIYLLRFDRADGAALMSRISIVD